MQCGLSLTDKTPATLSYETRHHIETVDDLRKHEWKDMPDTVARAMRGDRHCRQLLKQFGDTLNTERSEIKQHRLLRRGTLLTLPGSVMHAGPKSRSYRCLLFFSGWRKGSAVASYNPDIQYFGPLLCADLFALLYEKLSVVDRLYMIRQLDAFLSEYKNLYRHLSDDAMSKSSIVLGFIVVCDIFDRSRITDDCKPVLVFEHRQRRKVYQCFGLGTVRTRRKGRADPSLCRRQGRRTQRSDGRVRQEDRRQFEIGVRGQSLHGLGERGLQNADILLLT